MNAKTLYYPVWIAPGRKRRGWSWGRPCDSPREAVDVVRERMDDGAVLGCVVRFGCGVRTPMTTYMMPPSARRIAQHWDDLWDATDAEEPASES